MGAETGWRAVGIHQHVYRSLIAAKSCWKILNQWYIPET